MYDLIEVHFQFLWEDLDEHHDWSLRIDGIMAEVRTKNLPDTSLEYYCYSNSLGRLWSSYYTLSMVLIRNESG
jgi:hypothetical protein